MPSRQSRATAALRFLAYAVFVLFALSAALTSIWLAFPRWGMSPNQVYFFYCYAATLVLGLALLACVVAGMAALIVAVARQQRLGQQVIALLFLALVCSIALGATLLDERLSGQTFAGGDEGAASVVLVNLSRSPRPRPVRPARDGT